MEVSVLARQRRPPHRGPVSGAAPIGLMGGGSTRTRQDGRRVEAPGQPTGFLNAVELAHRPRGPKSTGLAWCERRFSSAPRRAHDSATSDDTPTSWPVGSVSKFPHWRKNRRLELQAKPTGLPAKAGGSMPDRGAVTGFKLDNLTTFSECFPHEVGHHRRVQEQAS